MMDSGRPRRIDFTQAGYGVRSLRRKPDDAECYVDDMRTTCDRERESERPT